MKIGILGGTFDPPHLGHLALGHAAKQALELDQVLFVPNARNPVKARRPSSPAHRLKMLEHLIEGEEGLSVTDIELTRGGPSYAIETVQELRLVYHESMWFIMGTDALKDILDWKDPHKLIALCRLGVVVRENDDVESLIRLLPPDFSFVIDRISMPKITISSSKIREDVMRGVPVEKWLKPAVWEYIKEVGLYRK